MIKCLLTELGRAGGHGVRTERSHSVNKYILLDEVEHDIMNYQNRGLCYLQQILHLSCQVHKLL